MTSYAAYDAELPCKNPSCKSHGRSHPNCECYGNLAHGGEVSHFCSESRLHDKACKYFADGGDVPEHSNALHSTAGYLGHGGLHSLIKMGVDTPDDPSHSINRYNQTVARGHKRLEAKMKGLFEGGSVDEKYDYSKAHKSINDWMDEGGIENDLKEEGYAQNEVRHFAEGGNVDSSRKKSLHDPHVTEAYPEQNMLLQAAKGRMSGYLNSLKPQQNLPKLTFDRDPDTREQKKSYDKAVKMAANPLSIVDKIQKGTIKPDDMEHLKNLHPEVEGMLQKKLTERIIRSQMEKKKPSLKVRQGLSLFFGTPMSSEMTPQGIQAAQAVFASKNAQQQQANPGKPKRSTGGLTDFDDSYMTSDQARIGRQQKQ